MEDIEPPCRAEEMKGEGLVRKLSQQVADSERRRLRVTELPFDEETELPFDEETELPFDEETEVDPERTTPDRTAELEPVLEDDWEEVSPPEQPKTWFQWLMGRWRLSNE